MIKGPDHPEEVGLDYEAVSDIVKMVHSMPDIMTAQDSFLSMVLSGPFQISIPKLRLKSNKDLDALVRRHWMPFLRKVYHYRKMLDLVPYYFERHGMDNIPIVPPLELGTISVTVTKKHKLKYIWRWNHGFQQEVEKKMYWIIGDNAPARDGSIRSALASLLPHYRTLLVLQKSLEVVAEQCAHPTHILEYRPSPTTAKNDDLTQLVANFGEKAAGMSKARQEAAKSHEIRVRTAELIKQTQMMQEANILNMGGVASKKLMWTDLTSDVAERMDPGLTTRMFPLRPDYYYVSAQKPTIVADYAAHLLAFNTMAAAVMDFSLELIRPTGGARSQNIKGSERFENERVKEAINYFTNVIKDAFILAYEGELKETFDGVKQYRLRKGGDPSVLLDLYPELDVEVNMSVTPFVNYDQVKEMWTDGIMNKEAFANHAFHMLSLPADQMEVREWPDKIPRELLVKENTSNPTSSINSSKPPKKKKKE